MAKSSSESPTPNKQKTFADIIPYILDGRHVARKEWGVPAPVYLKDGFLFIERNGIEHTLILHEKDLSSNDWYII